MQLGKMVH
ncbi:hypothetical protein E2C01_046692 [Portunus trituberculatus]|uniref:Uncharacterized protein n=1 Tax=Portunus trituberculatus TaxID=210409 RepID=A0A5B7G8F6_PORTR|nr:hypothetical protein [Portunus trituberculatus]